MLVYGCKAASSHFDTFFSWAALQSPETTPDADAGVLRPKNNGAVKHHFVDSANGLANSHDHPIITIGSQYFFFVAVNIFFVMIIQIK